MTFDDILADCIEALEQGATIRECLTRYPAHATALEPLLYLVVSLSRESQTRLSPQAFLRGRQHLAVQAQQRRAHHRQPGYRPPASPMRYAQPAAHVQNGAPQRHVQVRPSRTTKHAWGRSGMPRLLRTALLLMMFLGATTLFRQVMTSLPGTTLYPLKSTGEQLVGVLMAAAGEGAPWHASQAERYLQELAQLTNPNIMTAQTLSHVAETHWEAMLIASEGLPTTEREALLQAHITRLRQLEAAWTTPSAGTPQPAVATVRKLITAGEEALGRPQPIDNQPEVVETVTATATPTASTTPIPTMTPTPLLQASATAATTLPILVPSPTPTASPTPASPTVNLATPTAELPSPTAAVAVPAPMTPLPEMTVQMPQQESSQQPENGDNNDTDHTAEPTTVTATPPTEQPAEVTPGSPTATTTPDAEDGTATAEPTMATATAATPLPLTPATTEAQPTSVPANQTPQATVSAENTPPTLPTKTAPSATGTAGPTPEPPATATARPTNQATATKTPKATPTHAGAATATPDSSTNATAAPPTAVENTPNATAQPTTPPRDEAVQTPSSVSVTPVFSQPVKPRPTAPGGEPTKGAQP